MAIELLAPLTGQIVVGVPLNFSVLDDAGQLLLAAQRPVANAAQREMLLSRGMFAELSDTEEDDTPEQMAAQTLFVRWERLPRRLDRLLGTLGKAGFAERCGALADALAQLVDLDPDVALYTLVRTKRTRPMDWGLQHALHCALLATLATRRLGWPAAKTRSLVCAALTMNLAIVPVLGLIAQVGRVSEGQRERIHAHPQLAHDRLRAAAVEDPVWLEAVLQHHERVGGGGYPENLAQPGEAGVALAMVDGFVNRLSPRAGRTVQKVQDAARQMFAETSGHPVAAAIIKELGIVPPGQPVQLASGELGIVIRRGATAHTPQVAAVTDRHGRPVITTHVRDTAQPAYAIRSLEPDPKALQRVPAERLYGLVGVV